MADYSREAAWVEPQPAVDFSSLMHRTLFSDLHGSRVQNRKLLLVNFNVEPFSKVHLCGVVVSPTLV